MVGSGNFVNTRHVSHDFILVITVLLVTVRGGVRLLCSRGLCYSYFNVLMRERLVLGTYAAITGRVSFHQDIPPYYCGSP